MRLPVSLRRAAVAAVALTLGLPASNSIGSVAPGTITYQSVWLTVASPKPGVVLQRKTILVAGYRGYRTVWRLSWALGNPHVTLTADPLGWYRRSDSAFGGARIASLDRTGGGFVAGINGDTFLGGWSCDPCYLHGLLVHSRDVKNFGSGGPAVGFLPGGRMQMGQPAAVPVKLLLPGRGLGSSATVGAWNSIQTPTGSTIRADQVGVYTGGAARQVPSGYIAVTVQTPVFTGMLTGLHSVRNPTGLGLNESVQAFRFAEPAAPPVTVTVPIVDSATYPATFTVSPGTAVLVARLGSSGTVPYAGTGLQTLAARTGATRGVRVTLDDQGWSTVKDVMDGKFRLVARGVAQTAYPGWSDSWPWTCMGPGHGCWRTALARTATRGWLLIMGQRGSYYGLTTPDWARVLQRLGAVDAMGFDSNSAAELYRAGGAGIANPDGGRVIPATTALRYG